MSGQFLTRRRQVASSPNLRKDFATAAINTPEKAEQMLKALHEHTIETEFRRLGYGFKVVSVDGVGVYRLENQHPPTRSVSAFPSAQRAALRKVIEDRGGSITEIDSAVINDEGTEEKAKSTKKRSKKKKKSKKKKILNIDGDVSERDEDNGDESDKEQADHKDHEDEYNGSSSSTDITPEQTIILGDNITQPEESLENPRATSEPNDSFSIISDADIPTLRLEVDEDTSFGLESTPMLEEDSKDSTGQHLLEFLATPPTLSLILPETPEGPNIIVDSPTSISKSSVRTYISSHKDEGDEESELVDTEPDVKPGSPITTAIMPTFAPPLPTGLPIRYNAALVVRPPQPRTFSLPHPLPTMYQRQPAHTHTQQKSISHQPPAQPFLLRSLAAHQIAPQQYSHPLSEPWTLSYSNTTKSLHKQSSLPLLSQPNPQISKSPTAEMFSHGIIPLFTATTLEDLLGSYKALRRAIAVSKRRSIEPLGMRVGRGEGGLGVWLLEDDTNFQFFKGGVKPMWEDKMCSMGGKVMLAGNVKEVDQAFLDMIILLVSGELEDLSLSPTTPSGAQAHPTPRTTDQIVGIVLGKRKVVTRIEVWLSGGRGIPPSRAFVQGVEARFQREFRGLKFYGYKSFGGKSS